MLGETLKGAGQQIWERITSPLSSTLVLSWIVWNYRVILAILSDLDINAKFVVLNELTNLSCNATRLIWGPLVTTLVLIFFYPFPARFVYWFWRKQQHALRATRQRIEGETLLTTEESRRILTATYETERQYQTEIDRREAEIRRLKDLLKPMDRRPPENDSTNEKRKQVEGVTSDGVTEVEMKVLRVLGKEENRTGDQMTVEQVRKATSLQRVETTFALQSLIAKNLIGSGWSGDHEATVYGLQAAGREILLKSSAQQGE